VPSSWRAARLSSFSYPFAPNQTEDPTRAPRPMIVDSMWGEGPTVGIRSALAAYPGVAWLVLACDLPFLSDAALSQLLHERECGQRRHGLSQRHDGLPETAVRDLGRRRRARCLLPTKMTGVAALENFSFVIRRVCWSRGQARSRQRQYARGICAGVSNA